MDWIVILARRHLAKYARSQKTLFLIAGLINTLIGFVTYSICILGLGMTYQLATLAGLVLAVIAGFLQSRHGVFRKGSKDSLARYLVLWTALYFVSIWLIGLFIAAGFSEIEAYVIAIPLTVPLSFLAQKYWVFE